jgi:hypothetical protein
MKILFVSLVVAGLFMGCTTAHISPEDIIGKWNNAYQIQSKDENGKWSQWTTINTLVALPTLEFTTDGKILWDGKQSDFCCVPRTYTIKKGNVIAYSSGTSSCETVDCVEYKDWVVERLKNDTLEINQYYTKVRYLRGK